MKDASIDRESPITIFLDAVAGDIVVVLMVPRTTALSSIDCVPRILAGAKCPE